MPGSDWPSLSATALVTAAESYIQTPYHHGGRSKDGGVDCAGLAVCILRDLGVNPEDSPEVGQGDVFETMCATIDASCDQLETGTGGVIVRNNGKWFLISMIDQNPEVTELWPGDLLVFRGRSMFNHLGIFDGNGGMIHSYSSVGLVCRQPLDDRWVKRIVRVYRYKGAVL